MLISWRYLLLFFASILGIGYTKRVDISFFVGFMDEAKVEQLIAALMPLVGYWEYAEDIIAKLGEGTVSENEIEELAKILSNASNTAKTDEDFISMTIAYEVSNFWKKKEQTETLNRQDTINSTLHLLDTV